MDMLKLKKNADGKYILEMDEKFMSAFQGILWSLGNNRVTGIDRLIGQSMHEYCWGWNKLFNEREITSSLNGLSTESFEEHFEKELGFFISRLGINPSTLDGVKCPRCNHDMPKLDILKDKELGNPSSCRRCGNRFDIGNPGNQTRPVNGALINKKNEQFNDEQRIIARWKNDFNDDKIVYVKTNDGLKLVGHASDDVAIMKLLDNAIKNGKVDTLVSVFFA
jgi:hypothetical protein